MQVLPKVNFNNRNPFGGAWAYRFYHCQMLQSTETKWYDASEATRSTQEEFIYLDDDDSETSNDAGDPSFNPLEPTP